MNCRAKIEGQNQIVLKGLKLIPDPYNRKL